MTAFHLLAVGYLAVCGGIGAVVAMAFGTNGFIGAVVGVLLGILLVGALRMLVRHALPVRPPCRHDGCQGNEYELIAVRLDGRERATANDVHLLDDGFLFRCACGRLYFQTPRELGHATRFLAQGEDGVFRSYMCTGRYLGRWHPDPSPDPPRRPYRS